METPNREAIRLWVDALRSRQYSQGRESLHSVDENGGDRYCCLGVACEVAIANGVPLFVVRNHGGDKAYNAEDTTLPRTVARWLGLKRDNPVVASHLGGPIDAINANDNLDWSFARIADGLEATYLTGDTDVAHAA